ncbi:integrase [Rhodoligotrophos appendicifer]|uniref:tyrosine-type recombinase/integrase n=1 Tax=Rhodoligotrophos appendicifer TaxID=987056 RepID=UPI0014786A64|nr:site-specific integrase [Rhodoligotrophos appendicifer]
MTLDVAADKYWLQFGQFHKNSNDTFRDITRVVAGIGPKKLLRDITDDDVANLVARRRGEMRGEGDKARPLSNATVNRTIVEPLRQIFRKAIRTWKVSIPFEPDWQDHTLREPKERVRELSDDEEDIIEAALREDYRPIWRFSLITGLRMMEAVTLTWAQVDWSGGTLSITGKGGKEAVIPMDSDARAILSLLRGHHPTRVFTYSVQRFRDGRKRDERLPITKNGLKTAWRRARDKAVKEQPSLATFRWHDNRHTAATRMLRHGGGNIKTVQSLLRHSDVSTTAKYAHAQLDDVRTAMEAVAKSRKESRNSPIRRKKSV